MSIGRKKPDKVHYIIIFLLPIDRVSYIARSHKLAKFSRIIKINEFANCLIEFSWNACSICIFHFVSQRFLVVITFIEQKISNKKLKLSSQISRVFVSQFFWIYLFRTYVISDAKPQMQKSQFTKWWEINFNCSIKLEIFSAHTNIVFRIIFRFPDWELLFYSFKSYIVQCMHDEHSYRKKFVWSLN